MTSSLRHQTPSGRTFVYLFFPGQISGIIRLCLMIYQEVTQTLTQSWVLALSTQVKQLWLHKEGTSARCPVVTGYKALCLFWSGAAAVKAEGHIRWRVRQFINDRVVSKPSWKLTLLSSPPVSLFKSVSSCLTASIPNLDEHKQMS